MGECKGLNKAFREEDRKRPRQKDDEADDGQEEDRGKDARPAYHDPTKTIASIFGGRSISDNRQEQKLTA
jgi:hypothetical protein